MRRSLSSRRPARLDPSSSPARGGEPDSSAPGWRRLAASRGTTGPGPFFPTESRQEAPRAYELAQRLCAAGCQVPGELRRPA